MGFIFCAMCFMFFGFVLGVWWDDKRHQKEGVKD